MKQIITSIILLAIGLSSNAQIKKDLEIPNPEAPVVFMQLMEIPAKDIDKFIADWNEQMKTKGQMLGFITETLYRSLTAEAQYQIIGISQWQSYDAWAAANNDSGNHPNGGFYCPAAWSTNIYAKSFQSNQPSDAKVTPLQHAQKDSQIKSPESPFMFINQMEMEAKDIDPFVSDWKIL